jgi:uncharacterized membrane protein YsdA (DUF1294 family)
MPYLYYIIFYLWLINIATFALYAYDKHLAYYAKYRIPEFILIFVAFIGGAIGALLGMLFFKHKVRKPLFYIFIPIAFILLFASALLLDYPYKPDSLLFL